jgi:hypothetical protein
MSYLLSLHRFLALFCLYALYCLSSLLLYSLYTLACLLLVVYKAQVIIKALDPSFVFIK